MVLDAQAFAHWTPPPAALVEPAPDERIDDPPQALYEPAEPSDEPSGSLDVDSAGAEAPGEIVTAVGDYPILASPTISLPAFGAILTEHQSPAAPEYVGIYNAAVSYGVDPSVLLAVFQHESNFGKAGVAVHTKSIGNLRFYPGSAAQGATRYQTASNGSFAAYATYAQAAADASRLLASGLYGKSTNRNTVRTFPFRWAPAADHNAPAKYGASLAANIAKWTGNPGKPFTAPASTPPAHRAAVTSAVHRATAAVKGAGAGASSLATGSGLGSLPRSTVYAGLAIGGLVLLLFVVLIARSGRSSEGKAD